LAALAVHVEQASDVFQKIVFVFHKRFHLGGRRQPVNNLHEFRQAVLNQLPNDLVIDVGVTVDQNVLKRDQAAVVRNLGGDVFVKLCQLRHGLADDLEFALNGGLSNASAM
jgi:hypothetical protein